MTEKGTRSPNLRSKSPGKGLKGQFWADSMFENFGFLAYFLCSLKKGDQDPLGSEAGINPADLTWQGLDGRVGRGVRAHVLPV